VEGPLPPNCPPPPPFGGLAAIAKGLIRGWAWPSQCHLNRLANETIKIAVCPGPISYHFIPLSHFFWPTNPSSITRCNSCFRRAVFNFDLFYEFPPKKQ